MKLVTGIEAIQSGKPFRHVSKSFKSIWIDHCGTGMGSLSPADLLKQEFEMKPEPREFWIYLSPENGAAIAYHGYYAGVDFKNDRWIRVREVEK